MNDAILALLATIAGALGALLGVLLTLRANQRIFQTNLKEERNRSKEEREFSAKHNALLSAAESVARFLNYYMTLPDRDLPKDGTITTEISEMTVALNRLHFYCDIATIRQSITMGEILGKAVNRALKAKVPSMFIGEEIKAIDIQIGALETMNDGIQREIVALLADHPSNPLLVSHRQQLVTNFKSIAEFQSKKTGLLKAKYQATEACRDAIGQDLKTVYETLGAALLMARKELAFPIDEAEYTALLTQSTDSVLAEMEELLKEIRVEVNKKLNGVT